MPVHNGFKESEALMRRAREVIPGGVNSPVRAFGSVGGTPPFIEKAQGAYLWDVDGNRYIDYVGSWGPAIVGHAHSAVLETIAQVAQNGISFGAPTAREIELAEKVCDVVPAVESLRLVSSGTEACIAALRVARAFTKRDKVLKFTGCYHGHGDMFLVKAGSGALTLGLPDSPGVPKGVTADTLLASFNDMDAVHQVFANNKDQVAAVILEPIVGNAGFIRPTEQFVKGLREACTKHGALLIYDEVMTGFRVHWQSAQGLLGITPDLSTFGKVIGGGMPLAAYGGRKEIMNLVAPAGPVYQAGTLSGNPLAVACGLKTLEIIGGQKTYEQLEAKAQTMLNGFAKAAQDNDIEIQTDCAGGMFGLFFSDKPVRSFEQAKESKVDLFKAFFHGMLKRGIYLAPSAFEAGFISMAHTDDDIEQTIQAARESFQELH